MLSINFSIMDLNTMNMLIGKNQSITYISKKGIHKDIGIMSLFSIITPNNYWNTTTIDPISFPTTTYHLSNIEVY